MQETAMKALIVSAHKRIVSVPKLCGRTMPSLNETLGWTWICLGALSGAVIGLRFQDEAFMGGYASRPRRLVRLGHISLFGLGILNLLFASSAARAATGQGGAPALGVASWGFITGAVAMPVCCGLVAWRKDLHPIFVVPVLALAAAAGAAAWALGGIGVAP